ncbi:hypothetical protein ACFLKC_12975 [Clostridium caseinilyticum]|uniref:hypothetical protein n=1 Tax=Clostridium caseinilyticum TaxID=3350403 RepID=UPI0038F5DC96
MVIVPDLELYSIKYNTVQQQAGLNWGFSYGHTCLADAYIALTTHFLRSNPNFFPSQGSPIITEWDDGTVLQCLLEGTQEINGIVYPKQISSDGDKSTLGYYLRRRIGVSPNHRIAMSDLTNYGRNYVSVSYIEGNRYYFDFH